MRVFLLLILMAVFCSIAQSQVIPGEPFDKCGIFQSQYLAGWCYRLVVSGDSIYELGGDFTGFAAGDTIRVYGEYFPESPSVCMSGQNCCVVVDSVEFCDLEPIPGTSPAAISMLAAIIMVTGVWLLRKLRLA